MLKSQCYDIFFHSNREIETNPDTDMHSKYIPTLVTSRFQQNVLFTKFFDHVNQMDEEDRLSKQHAWNG
jgi:hypothetical protein